MISKLIKEKEKELNVNVIESILDGTKNLHLLCQRKSDGTYVVWTSYYYSNEKTYLSFYNGKYDLTLKEGVEELYKRAKKGEKENRNYDFIEKIENILNCQALGIDFNKFTDADDAIKYTLKKYPEIKITQKMKKQLHNIFSKTKEKEGILTTDRKLTREQLIKKIAEIYNQNKDKVDKKIYELEEEAERKGLSKLLYDTNTYAVEIIRYWNEEKMETLYNINEEWTNN